jgi:uncharacterized protein
VASDLVASQLKRELNGIALMLIYLDSVICIYAVEGAPAFQAAARARLGAMLAAGEKPAISDLTWLECRVKPIRTGDAVSLADMEAFLTASDVVRLPMPRAVYERACQIRATLNHRLADALHLAAAIEGGCGLFLTNDCRLSTFADIPVEVVS